MLNGLPALLGLPPAVSGGTPATDGAAAADWTALRIALDGGLPARMLLSGERTLVLSVALGRARPYLAADPAAVVVDLAAADPVQWRDPDIAQPRLTLVESGTIGDSIAVVPGHSLVLTRQGTAVAEVVVDGLTVTVGSLRSPGEFGSSLALRWRLIGPSSNTAPSQATGDDSIPRQRPRLPRLARWAAIRGGIG